MADPDFSMGRGDSFLLEDQLTDDDGNSVDVSGASSIVLRYRDRDHTIAEADAIGGPGTDPVNGDVQYRFAAADTLAGPARDFDLLINWIVTFPDGSQITVPTDRKKVIFVQGPP